MVTPNCNKLLVFLLTLLLTLPVSLATFANEWGEYQDDTTRRGFTNDEVGQWNATGTRTVITDGADFQPLAIDADNDTLMNIIGSDGNFLKIWEVNSDGTLVLDDERNFGATQTVTMTAMPTGYDNDNYKEFMVVFGTNLSVVEYNGTSINIECSNTTVGSAVTGIVCGNFSGNNISCFFGNNGGNLTGVNALTCNVGVTTNITNDDIFTTLNGVWTAPVMADIDRDTSQELIFACDWGNAGSEDICVFDVLSGLLDTGFSTDGVYEITPPGASNARIGGVLVYNVGGAVFDFDSCVQTCKDTNPLWWLISPLASAIEYTNCKDSCVNQLFTAGFGGGDSEVVFTYYGVGGGNFDQDVFLEVLKSDGSRDWIRTVIDDLSGSITYLISSPVVMGTQFNNDDSQAHFCVVTDEDQAADRTHTDCYTESNVWVFNDINPAGDLRWDAHNAIVAASMTSVDDDDFDLVVSNGIMQLHPDSNTSTTFNFTGEMNDNPNLNVLVVDANRDHNLDVCAQTGSLVFCAYSPYVNEPPVVNNTPPYGGYGYDLDHTRPLCVNDTITFRAQECGGTITDCNYNNDIAEDLERIVSNCGQATNGVPAATFTENLANGSYAGSTISNFSCFYNLTGTYNVRLHLQDDANTADFTAFNTETIVVQVVQGTPGLDCSFIASVLPGTEEPETPASQQQAAVDDSIDATLGILFGTSTRLKNMAAIGIIIAIMFIVAYQVKNTVAVIVSALLGTIMVTFIGLLSPWILILIMVGLVLLVILGKFVVGAGTAG